MTRPLLVECRGVLIWRGPIRRTSGPREFANAHHRQDHDRLVERLFQARIRNRGRAPEARHPLREIPRLIEHLPPTELPRLLRVV